MEQEMISDIEFIFQIISHSWSIIVVPENEPSEGWFLSIFKPLKISLQKWTQIQFQEIVVPLQVIRSTIKWWLPYRRLSENGEMSSENHLYSSFAYFQSFAHIIRIENQWLRCIDTSIIIIQYKKTNRPQSTSPQSSSSFLLHPYACNMLFISRMALSSSETIDWVVFWIVHYKPGNQKIKTTTLHRHL